jgi:hypothetical protein
MITNVGRWQMLQLNPKVKEVAEAIEEFSPGDRQQL